MFGHTMKILNADATIWKLTGYVAFVVILCVCVGGCGYWLLSIWINTVFTREVILNYITDWDGKTDKNDYWQWLEQGEWLR